MNKRDLLTIVFLIISIFYALIVDRFLRSRGERSFIKGMMITTPGLILILALFAWLALSLPFSMLLVLVTATAIYIVVYTLSLKRLAGFLSRFSSIQKWRKEFLRNRILKERKRGHSARAIQRRGLIPDNDKLKEFGFSDGELKELGLLKKEE